MNRIHSLLSVALAAIALSSVACTAPQAGEDESDGNTGALAQGAARDLTAPTPEPSVIKCITALGTYEGTQSACEGWLKTAGCDKPGAVVNGTQKCSTAR